MRAWDQGRDYSNRKLAKKTGCRPGKNPSCEPVHQGDQEPTPACGQKGDRLKNDSSRNNASGDLIHS